MSKEVAVGGFDVKALRSIPVATSNTRSCSLFTPNPVRTGSVQLIRGVKPGPLIRILLTSGMTSGLGIALLRADTEPDASVKVTVHAPVSAASNGMVLEKKL